MTVEKATALLEKEYGRAMQRDDVLNPVAWTLYQVWKKADEGTPWDEIEPEQLQHVAVNTNPLTSAERQACFRLGQMDVQQSVLQLLQALAESLKGAAQNTVIDVSCMVESMQVLGSGTGGACNG